VVKRKGDKNGMEEKVQQCFAPDSIRRTVAALLPTNCVFLENGFI